MNTAIFERVAMALGLLLLPMPAAANSLREVETLYSAGNFADATQKINVLLADDAEMPLPERARLYLMKARIQLAYGRKEELRLWLTKAHQADPNLTLNPVLDPPQLTELWEDTRLAAKTVKMASKVRTDLPLLALLAPLGGGHFFAGRYRDGGLFLSTELLLMLSAPKNIDSQTPHAREIFGAVTLLGAYGYELVDLLPELGGNGERFALFPFGVGQAKNGETGKAIAVAALQAGLLGVGVLTSKAWERDVALVAFGTVWLLAIVDSFVNATPGSAERHVDGVGLMPTLVETSTGRFGAGLKFRLMF